MKNDMREILFRGKSVDAGKWVEGDLIHSFGRTYCGIYAETLKQIDPTTVGQYTGLKDKNGVRIFEGDIVMATYRGNYVRCAFEVIFRDYRFALLKNGVLVEMHDGYRIEVIGNIHDNPELLEGGC